MKTKHAWIVATVALSAFVISHDIKAEEGTRRKNVAAQRQERVHILMRKAAAYTVTDVLDCIGGVRFAASLYGDLLRQEALQSAEYTKYSIDTQLRFALENGTPVDMNAFWIVFEMLRQNGASWDEVSENEGKDYARQTTMWEAITCKFNSGYAGIFESGQLTKHAVVQIVDHMIAEQLKGE